MCVTVVAAKLYNKLYNLVVAYRTERSVLGSTSLTAAHHFEDRPPADVILRCRLHRSNATHNAAFDEYAHHEKIKSVVKEIWHKAASPPHMGGSIVFARLCHCAPPSNTCFFPNHIPNSISTGSAVFAQLTAECPTVLLYALSPSQNYPLHGGSGPPSNTWFPGPTQSLHSKRHVNRFSCFCRAHVHDRHNDLHTNRETDNATPSNNRPHLRSTAMRRKNTLEFR